MVNSSFSLGLASQKKKKPTQSQRYFYQIRLTIGPALSAANSKKNFQNL